MDFSLTDNVIDILLRNSSHSLLDDLFIEESESITNNYFEIFRNIFVYTGQESHYDMMMGVKD